MHLPELPTIFVKGGEERKAYFTIQAKELLETGWIEKPKTAPVKKSEEKPAATKPAKTSTTRNYNKKVEE